MVLSGRRRSAHTVRSSRKGGSATTEKVRGATLAGLPAADRLLPKLLPRNRHWSSEVRRDVELYAASPQRIRDRAIASGQLCGLAKLRLV
jgi:hypothetical protein